MPSLARRAAPALVSLALLSACGDDLTDTATLDDTSTTSDGS